MLDAGRELDALIALQVFRYTLDYEFADTLGAPCVRELRDATDEWGMLPHYSTEIGDAWRVVEHFYQAGWGAGAEMDGHTGCRAFVGQFTSEADSPSLAICRAALQACGVPLDTPARAVLS